MAVTNAQLHEMLDNLSREVVESEQRLQAKLDEYNRAHGTDFNIEGVSKSLANLERSLTLSLHQLGGDRTEIIYQLGIINDRLSKLEAKPAKKTWRERYDDFMQSLVGTNPAR